MRVTALPTLVGVLLFQNLAGSEMKIDRQLPMLYKTDDGEFRRSFSPLLGPQIVDVTKIDTLLNGGQIFPAMLAGIRAARTTLTVEA